MRSYFSPISVVTLFVCLPVCFAQTPATAPAAAPAPFPTGIATPLGAQVAAITSEPGVVRAHWGIAVTALDGTPIYGMNEGQFFQPASNAKLFTTAAAMHLLGPDTRLSTTATAATPDSKTHVVLGDIVLHGTGDANISGRAFPYLPPAERRRLAAARVAAGGGPEPVVPLQYLDRMAADIANNVHQITGDVVGDDTLWPAEPYASDWTIDDAVWGYGAPVSALTVDDNQMELTVKPADVAGQPATASVVPDIGYYEMKVDVKTVAAKTPVGLRIDRAPGSHTVRIVGTVAVGEPYSTELAIDDPAEFAAQAFKAALEQHGVQVDGHAMARHREPEDTEGFSTESHVPLPGLPVRAVGFTRPALEGCTGVCPLRDEHVSPTLAEDITLTLKVSQNLHAELLLRRLGKEYGTDGSTAQGARVVRQFLLNAGLDGDDFMFYDGSGLSGHDIVTPRATAALLKYATTQPWFAKWKAALPVGGQDGTLAGRFSNPPLKDHLFAKTGTLSEARALSGYVDCASGRTVIFSVMVDNHAPNTGADRAAMDRIVEAVAAAE